MFLLAWAQNGDIHELCHSFPETLTGNMVTTKVLSGINKAQSSFLCCGGETGEVACHPRK